MDYDVIVGGGSAGCSFAAPLSEDAQVKVLLLEAGGSGWNPLFHWPAGIAKMTKGIASWIWSSTVSFYIHVKVMGDG